jgi:hypothetical protein
MATQGKDRLKFSRPPMALKKPATYMQAADGGASNR